ncbi:MAG: MFS transporter [Bacillota bacterium]
MIRRRWLSYVLVWTSFFDQLAWTPVLVLIAAAVQAPEALAWAASLYSVANLLGNALFGLLSDRLDRYGVAGAGLLAMGLTGALHLGVTSPGALLGVRFLHGLAIAAVAPAALASVTDGIPRNRRGEVLARVGLVIAIASMLATSAMGRVVSRVGMAAGIAGLAALVGLVGAATLLLRHRMEPLPPVRMRRLRGEGELPPTALNPAMLGAAVLVAFALMFLQNVLFYAYPLQARALGMSPAAIGGTLAVFGLGSMLAFLPPLSRAADRWGRHRPLFLGLLLAGAGLMGLARWTAMPALAASLFIYGLGFGLVFPAVSALNADAAGQGRRGLAFGLLTAAFSLGSITGPLVTQALAAYASPFAVAGGLALATGLITVGWYYWAARPVPHPTGPGVPR